MWTDIFSMNEKNISIAIEELIQNLNLLKDQITNEPKILRNLLIELKDFKESNY
jgi:prephenate dehydrogenase